MEAEKKQELIDEVVEQIKNDIMSGDCTVLDELLSMIPTNILIHSLPEEKWSKYYNK